VAHFLGPFPIREVFIGKSYTLGQWKSATNMSKSAQCFLTRPRQKDSTNPLSSLRSLESVVENDRWIDRFLGIFSCSSRVG